MGSQISSGCHPNGLQELIDLREILSINHTYHSIKKLYGNTVQLVILYLDQLFIAQESARQLTIIEEEYCILGYSSGKFYIATYQNRSSRGYCPIQEVELSVLHDLDRQVLEEFVPKNKESYGYCFPSIKALNDKIEELIREEELKEVFACFADSKLNSGYY